MPTTNSDRSKHFAAIEKKHGEKAAVWLKRLKDLKTDKYQEQIAFLRENHGFSQAHANALVMWTQAQVDRHKSDSIAQLREILISQKSKFDVVLPNIPSPVNSQFVMDAVTHEHDLREALGKPGAQDSLAVKVAFAWLASNSMYPKELVDKLRASKATEFQLMRAMTGRISVEQMNELNLPGDEIASLTVGSPFKAPPSNGAN